MSATRLRLGVAGLGRAFTLMLPTFLRDPRIELVAAADSRAEALARFAADFHANTHRSIEQLCDDPRVEAVYIATPHQFHAQHARLAAERGKHILVEKPMALSLDECRSMIDAARQAGVQLIVGHSHSFDAPILHARSLIASGALGELRTIQALNYTDFLYRPRRPEELVTASGGGVIFSQAAHQIDVARLLGGGRVRSVRAMTGAWDRARPTEGAYSALLEFESGAFASLSYGGYGHFDSDEFCGWVGELGQPKDPARYGAARRALEAASSADEEAMLKAARAYGGKNYVAAGDATPRHHQHFGFVLASCDHADLRPTPDGVQIYGDREQRLERLPVPEVPRAEVIDELHAAIVEGQPPLHSGEWALATMEVCFAMLESSRERRDIILRHQVAARD